MSTAGRVCGMPPARDKASNISPGEWSPGIVRRVHTTIRSAVPRFRPATVGPDRPQNPLSLVLAPVGWIGALTTVWAVGADADRGLDMMDESHYLLAAQPWASDKAFNGMFGWYLRPMLWAVDVDLARLRLLGVCVLVGTSIVYARAVREALANQFGDWPPVVRSLWTPATICSAMCFYTVFVRTPGYNWFATVGLMFVSAGMLKVATATRYGWSRSALSGLTVGGGLWITAMGKLTTAVGAAAVVVVSGLVIFARGHARQRRTSVESGLWSAGGLALALVVHTVLVNDFETTITSLRRLRHMMALVDVDYSTLGAMRSILRGVADVVVLVPLPFLPLVVASSVLATWLSVIGGRSGWVIAGCWCAGWIFCLGAVLVLFPGGTAGLTMAALPPILAAGTACVTLASQRLLGLRTSPQTALGHDAPGWEDQPSRLPPLALALSSLAFALCLPLGTNVSYLSQIHGAFPLLMTTAIIGPAALSRSARGPSTIALLVGMVILAPVLLITSRAVAPYRTPPLSEQRTELALAGLHSPVRVDGDTASWAGDLRTGASRGGFRPGDPLLELTWHPGAVLVLDARAPRTLLPAFPGLPRPWASAIYSLHQEDPDVWRRSWLLVPAEQDLHEVDRITQVVGRRFPDDYRLMATATAPFDHQGQELWAPK